MWLLGGEGSSECGLTTGQQLVMAKRHTQDLGKEASCKKLLHQLASLLYQLTVIRY